MPLITRHMDNSQKAISTITTNDLKCLEPAVGMGQVHPRTMVGAVSWDLPGFAPIHAKLESS